LLGAENKMERSILHMDLDTFFVSVERLTNSSLHGKPVLIGGKSGRGVVASCSYEARKFGVHSAMPMKMALHLCPDAVILRGDMEQYSYYSNLITQIIKEDVPLYEKTSIDEFYIDLSGMEHFFGTYLFATELRKKIERESGLNISFGLSCNKTVSKITTGEVKPAGQGKVEQGTEKNFLAPLSVRKIPMVGKVMFRNLAQLGINKIRTLQEMPSLMLERAFGKNGIIVWQKANGIDKTPVVPYSERKSISAEKTFQKDTIDINKLNAYLISMTEQLAHKLRKEHKLASVVTVKIRYSNFETFTQQLKISYTSSDELLISSVKLLFKKLFNRRMLIRLIGVRFSGLVNGGYQTDLFEDTQEQLNLCHALDHINRKYGSGTVKRAIGLGLKNKFAEPIMSD
jgi:DNA polymerase-4